MGKDCGWEHPRAPAVRKPWDERATEAVLEFLEDTRVECWTAAGTAKRQAEGVGQSGEGEEGGPEPPYGFFLSTGCSGARGRLWFYDCTGPSVLALVSFVFFLKKKIFFFLVSFVRRGGLVGEKERGVPRFDSQ